MKRKYVIMFRNGHREIVLAENEYKAVDEATATTGQHEDDVLKITAITAPSHLPGILLLAQAIVFVTMAVVAGISYTVGYWHPKPFIIGAIFVFGLATVIVLIDGMMQKRKIRTKQLEASP